MNCLIREGFFNREGFLSLRALDDGLEWQDWLRMTGFHPLGQPRQSNYLHSGISVLIQEVFDVPKSQSSLDDSKMHISPGVGTPHAI